MTQRQLNPWKYTPAWVITQESWVSGAPCRSCRQQGWWICLLSPEILYCFYNVLLTLGTSFESFLYFRFLIWFLCYMNLMTFPFCSRRGVTPQRVFFFYVMGCPKIKMLMKLFSKQAPSTWHLHSQVLSIQCLLSLLWNIGWVSCQIIIDKNIGVKEVKNLEI